jgi:hypothetical protein
MSKKRRKRHEQTKPAPRQTTPPKSISTMADVMPADLLKQVEQELDKRGTAKTHVNISQGATLRRQAPPSTTHQSTNATYAAKVSSSATPAPKAPISKPAISSASRIPKPIKSPAKEILGLAEIAAKTVLKPNRSFGKKRKTSAGLDDWRSELSTAESKERRHRYAEIILNSLGSTESNAIPINLGIDLGTSFSKVVWRGPDKAYPICFGDNPASLNDYLVPSIVVFDGTTLQTGLSDTEKLSTQNAIANFKMCLACVSDSGQECQPYDCELSNWSRALNSLPEPVELVNATYLAHLISRSRELVQTHLRKLGVKNQSIFWSANLAVPEKYMDASPILRSFDGVFRTAWLMAALFDEMGELNRTQEVIESYACAKAIAASNQALDCSVYPEVAAEVASVTKPRSAKQGLYAFVDVGAGTVDGTVFRFYRPLKDDPSQFTYAASVIRAGAAHVELDASDKLGQLSRAWFKRMKEDGGHARGLSLTPELILDPPFDESLGKIRAVVKDELIQLFHAAHDKEPGEDKWRDLQMIIGGGGAALPLYVNAAREAFTQKGVGRGGNLTSVSLDAPSDFEMGRLSHNTFHRFAVAYGLSFHRVNLPDVVLAKDVHPGGPGRVRDPIIDPTMDD